jgi:hypothetical protein
VAAALGYTVHLLLLASKYLEVSVPAMCILVSVPCCVQQQPFPERRVHRMLCCWFGLWASVNSG